MSISPRELTELFASAGYQLTERRLTDWRSKGWIADVRRQERPAGTGRGAHYEWLDTEIIAQVFTVLSLLELRGRMETASVLAWFSGFDVPRSDIRNLWVAFESLPWEKTLQWALAGEEGSVRDAVDSLVRGERDKQHKKKDGYSDDFVEVISRMGVDPNFDAKTQLPIELVASILTSDVPKLVSGAGAEIGPMLSADRIRSLAILVQDYWSAPRRTTVIQRIPDEMLAKAHADVRFLLSPYRAWVESSVRRMADEGLTDGELSMMLLGPRLAWQVGRLLMELDVALRRLGCGDEVDATIAMLRDLAARDETRHVVEVFREHWQALARSEVPGDAELASNELIEELRKDSAYEQAGEIFMSFGSALKDLWLPPMRRLLVEASEDDVE